MAFPIHFSARGGILAIGLALIAPLAGAEEDAGSASEEAAETAASREAVGGGTIRKEPVLPRPPFSVDVRGWFGTAAQINDLEVGGLDVGTDSEHSSAGGLYALYGYRPGNGNWGWLVGGGFTGGSRDAELDADDDTHFRYSYSALMLTGGLLWRPVPEWSLELRPHVEFGVGNLLTVEDLGNDTYQVEVGEDEGYAATGLTAGGWYSWPSGFQIGGELGVEAWVGESEFNNQDIELEGIGPVFRLGIGYRWW